jgi:hypothetical protein
MPATIQSSSEFAAGEIALLSHDCRVSANGLIEVGMSFAFLSTPTFTPRNLAKFGKGAVPPVALPSSVQSSRPINGAVYLLDYTAKSENGICYVQANYVGTNGGQSVSVSYSVQSYSGYGTAEVNLGANPAKVEITFAISFDYAMTITSYEYVEFKPQSKLKGLAIINGEWNKKTSVSLGGTNFKSVATPRGMSRPYFTAKPIGPLWIINDTAELIIESP